MSAKSGGPTPSDMRASEVAYDAAAEGYEEPELPESTFLHLVLSLQHQALVLLGDAPDPGSGEPLVDLQLARQTIDFLAVLDEKTRGNLTGEDEHLLHQALHDLRNRFVEVARAKK